jgi:hypothetical protein
MFPGGRCAERERLLRRAVELINAHIQAVEEFSKKIGKENSTTREAALQRDEIRTSFAMAQAAWEEYGQHVKEHGC